MYFDSLDVLFECYKEYGKQEGFGVMKKTSKSSIDETMKFVTLACSRSGKSRSQKQNYLAPNPMTKFGCKARINATILGDGKCKVNSVVVEHNHNLTPNHSRFFACNREISTTTQTELELKDRAGTSVIKNCHSLVVGAEGYDQVPCLEKDCWNFIEKAGQLRLVVGDAQALHDYFVRMQANNSNFFYAVDVGDDARVKTLFWADARSRAAYKEFGDVVTFDTTYLTNKYNMPFASFVGVNHHGQSVLLGCGLLSNEDTGTFIWLFQTWLACMLGRAPDGIITDQDKAMKNAVEVVFPHTRHRWCLWHIMKKLPERLRGYKHYEEKKQALHNVIYDSLTKKEFEENWQELMNDLNLSDNPWLRGLYEERHRWVPAFVKDSFWAGMSTTQRSDSMNAFFDGYVNSKTTIKQFLEQCDNALRNKIEKENLADFQSFSTVVPCVTQFQIEKQFQVFTHAKFKEFQKELTGKLYCDVFFVNETEGLCEVLETIFFEDKQKVVRYNVHLKKEDCEICCTCCLFESRGILCKHALSVFIRMQITEVPLKYILPRWRRDLQRSHTRVKVSYDDLSHNPEAQRFQIIQKKFDKLANRAATNEETSAVICKWIDEVEAIINENNSFCGNNPLVNVIRRESASHPSKNWKVSPVSMKRAGKDKTLKKKTDAKV